MILEAMKMQMPLLAPMSGKVIMKISLQCVHAVCFVQVKALKVKENDSVMDDDLLLEFELTHQPAMLWLQLATILGILNWHDCSMTVKNNNNNLYTINL